MPGVENDPKADPRDFEFVVPDQSWAGSATPMRSTYDHRAYDAPPRPSSGRSSPLIALISLLARRCRVLPRRRAAADARPPCRSAPCHARRADRPAQPRAPSRTSSRRRSLVGPLPRRARPGAAGRRRLQADQRSARSSSRATPMLKRVAESCAKQGPAIGRTGSEGRVRRAARAHRRPGRTGARRAAQPAAVGRRHRGQRRRELPAAGASGRHAARRGRQRAV